MADVITSTQLATKQTLISQMVQKELASKSVLSGFITDVSSMAISGLDTIKFPKLSSFVAGARAEGAQGFATAISSSVDTLSLDTNLYVSWILDSVTVLQNNINAEIEFAKLGAAAQARAVTNAIVAKLRSSAASFQNVGTDANMTYANLLAMKEAILTANGDVSQCTLIISPSQQTALFNIAEIKNWNQFGQAVLPSGVVGNVLGMPVVVSNSLAAKEAFLVEKSAMVIGFQKNAAYGEAPAIDYGVGAKKVAIEQLFGISPMQTGLMGAAAGKSPLIVGLND